MANDINDSGARQYFIKVCGSQRLGNRPKFSHTYAAFIEQQVRQDESVVRRILAISWLPRSGDIKPLGPPERGRNYSLRETLAWLDQAGSTLHWESPETEIQPGLFQSAVDRIQELERGVLQYVMIDSFQSRPHDASNCIHAVTDLPLALGTLGMTFTGILHGIQASRFVYQYLSPFYSGRSKVSEESEKLVEELQRAHFQAALVHTTHAKTLKQLVEHAD